MKRRNRILPALLSLGLCLFLTACGEKTTIQEEILPQVRISELMGENKSITALPDGSFTAWLELENYGAEPADLGGFSFAVGEETWTIEGLTLSPGEYRLLFCGDPAETSDGVIRCAVTLDREGETLCLLSPLGTELDSVQLPTFEKDKSWVREADGNLIESDLPSPGYDNSEAGYLAFQRELICPDDLGLSEVMVYNARYPAPDGGYYDWVEISNYSDRSLNLGDYCLSDKEKDRMMFRLPEQFLAPGESRVIFCSKDAESTDFAPFSLNARGETLYLSRRDGTLCDYAALYEIPEGCSMGRMRGESGWFYFASPSPGQRNAGGVRFVSEKPSASRADGVFENVGSVTVELAGEGTIRYTLDGSMPTESSFVYTGPFVLTETGVVRARSFVDGRIPSETLSLSYILNEGHSLPVVSLVCDPGDLFGNEGIYTNPEERWERRGCVMFYAGEESFRLDCGVKLHGATSRVTQSKKSFKLMFRDRYEGRLYHDLFGNGVTEFSSILLRAAQEADQSTLMRDNLMHQLSLQAFPELPAQDYRYAVLYLNGEYWGVYNIREAHSAAHFAGHYGHDEDGVSQWQGEWPEDSVPAEVFAFASTHDLRDPENYALVSRYVDTDSVIAWCIMQVYSGNFDFNSPNMRFYFSTQDQKLRYGLVDLDLGMFDYGSFANMFSFGYAYNYLASYLMQNESFRHDMIRKLAEAVDGPLSDENALALIDALADELRPEIARDHALWGGTLESWERMVEHLREYILLNKGRAMDVVELLEISGFVKKTEMREFFPES